jgi:hypothetical protein
MPQTIQHFRTTGAAAPATVLPAGLYCVMINATDTKIWLGDGVTNPGRLILSTDPTDNPIMTGDYLLLSGGIMSGQINQPALPTLNPHLANKLYVDTAIAAYSVFRGAWRINTNTPDISGGDTVNGANYIATTASGAAGSTETTTVALPGIPSGTSIRHGDRIIWVEGPDLWQIIGGGSLDITAADGRYVNVIGDGMTGTLTMSGAGTQVVLPNAPTAPADATRKDYVDGLVGAYLPLVGGVVTGDIQMSGVGTQLLLVADPTVPLEAATKQYVDNIPFGVVTDGVSIIGDGVAVATQLEVNIVDGGTF